MSVRELRHDRPSGWFSKSRGLSASVSILYSPPPPRSFTSAIFRAVFDSRSSFFPPKPLGNACYVGYACKTSCAILNDWWECISVLMSAITKSFAVFFFFSGKLIYKSNNWKIPVFAWPDVNNRGVGRPLDSLFVMKTHDFVSGLHNCREFSQPLSCLYQAMQTRKTFSIASYKQN